MLNREDVIRIINELKLPKDKFVITSGSAMVLHGLREGTNDVDITVNKELFEYFEDKGYYVKYYKINENRTCVLIDLTYDVQIIRAEEIPSEYVTIVDGIPTQTIEHLLKFKLELNRDKDQNDIKVLKKYLKLDEV
jgi:hypothetical protein